MTMDLRGNTCIEYKLILDQIETVGFIGSGISANFYYLWVIWAYATALSFPNIRISYVYRQCWGLKIQYRAFYMANVGWQHLSIA